MPDTLDIEEPTLDVTSELDALLKEHQLDGEQIGKWWKRIEAARTLRKDQEDEWRENIEALRVRHLDAISDDTVVVVKDFVYSTQKKAQLFFQVPEIVAKPKRPGLESHAALFGSVINHELGPDGANILPMLQQAKDDVIACGVACTRIGYEAAMGERPAMDPMTGQPAIDPLTGQPVMEPYPIHETYYWESVSPDQMLIPAEFEGMDFDKSPWLGIEFEMPIEEARTKFDLPDDFVGTTVREKRHLSSEKERASMRPEDPVVQGVELWYRARRFDPTEPHPEKIRNLVLIEGLKERVAKHIDSPYQAQTQDGKLIGMMGYPIHVLTIRVVRGCAYPTSDVSITRHLSDEQSMFRTQMIRVRNRSMPQGWVDRTKVDPEIVSKLERNEAGAWIGLDGSGVDKLGLVPHGQLPREAWQGNEVLDRDQQEAWGLGGKAGLGVTEDTTRTATELRETRAAADARLAEEQNLMLAWFVRGVRKFAALIQMFKDDPSYVEIVGPEGQQVLAQWDKQAVAGEFVFEAKPDSQLRMDITTERKQALDVYNLTGKDPHVNRVELLKALYSKFGIDHTRVIVPQLPEAKPEPPKVTFAIRLEDLAMGNPAAPIGYEVLEQFGIKVSPAAIQNSAAVAAQAAALASSAGPPGPGPNRPAAHGGPAVKMSPVNQHVLDTTGTGQGNPS